MYNILTLNEISKGGLALLENDKFTCSKDIENPDGILVRSAKMHDMELPKNLLAVARAGAGVNNIPIDKCTENGVVVFNTPGANANAVKELTIAGLILSCRKIAQGIAWAKTLDGDVAAQVEKGKKAFVGPEIAGKKLGVIGLGAIGVLVANAAVEMGMEVIGYDPFLNVSAAWHLSRRVERETDLDNLLEKCDFITIHIPATAETKGYIGEDFLSKCKNGVRIVNFARGELVDTAAMKNALHTGKVAVYTADFPSEDLIAEENVVMTPHLGASTPESEDLCALMAAGEMRNYLLYGNIEKSVNLPDCVVPFTGKPRITIINKNIPNMIGSVTAIFAREGVNIDNMINRSRGAWAYTMIDVDGLGGKADELKAELEAVDGIVKVRIIEEVK